MRGGDRLQAFAQVELTRKLGKKKGFLISLHTNNNPQLEYN